MLKHVWCFQLDDHKGQIRTLYRWMRETSAKQGQGKRSVRLLSIKQKLWHAHFPLLVVILWPSPKALQAFRRLLLMRSILNFLSVQSIWLGAGFQSLLICTAKQSQTWALLILDSSAAGPWATWKKSMIVCSSAHLYFAYNSWRWQKNMSNLGNNQNLCFCDAQDLAICC